MREGPLIPSNLISISNELALRGPESQSRGYSKYFFLEASKIFSGVPILL